MRKKLFAFFVCIFVLLNVFVFFNNFALAADDGEAPESMLRDGVDRSANISGLKPAEGTDITLPVLIGKFLKGGIALLGLVFLILILYAGITWMIAGGDEKNITKAQKTMVNAAIGLVVALLAYQLTSYVIGNIHVVDVAPAAVVPPAGDNAPPPAPNP